MARKPRNQLKSGIYHVLSRGHNGKEIFKQPQDYERFLETIYRYKQKIEFKLLAYALIPNHFHLLIKLSSESSLSKIMQCLLTSYSIYFNKQNSAYGYVFQGRFKSFPVFEDPYLIQLVRYIHDNPVRANLADSAKEYAYTSYAAYNRSNKPKHSLVDTDFMLNELVFFSNPSLLLR